MISRVQQGHLSIVYSLYIILAMSLFQISRTLAITPYLFPLYQYPNLPTPDLFRNYLSPSVLQVVSSPLAVLSDRLAIKVQDERNRNKRNRQKS